MAANGNGHVGQHDTLVLEMTPQAVTQDLVGRVLSVSPAFKWAVGVLSAVFVAGIIGFVLRAVDGTSDRGPWAYYVATFAFLLTAFGSAPLVAVGFRLTKNHFRRPLSRAAEMFALVGVLNLLWFIPMIILFPSRSLAERRSIWFEVPIQGDAPIILDSLAIIFLVVLGLAILHVSALPDMAALRERGGPLRRFLFGPLVPRWRGTDNQWALHKASLAILGAFYFMMLIFVHFLVFSDFSKALIPGWTDSIMPAQHALTGLQAGLAMVVVTGFLLRTVGGYRDYIGLDFFWSASKILLGLSLLWGYFWFAEFNTMWYGRKPIEQAVIRLLMTDQYAVAFYLNLFGSFIIPLAMLIWNPVRKSILGPTIAAGSILFGAFFMMVRLYVPAFTMKDIGADSIVEIQDGLTAAGPAQLLANGPGGPDVLIVLGGLAGAALIFLLGTRLLPVVSLWEMKEGLMYQVARPFVRGRYMVLGKPE